MDKISFDLSEAPDTPLARQRKYEHRVTQAIRDSRFWAMLWAELARDFNAVIANILHLWRQVDSHFTSRTPRR